MTKSQLTIRLSSKKLDRRVSPIRPRPVAWRFNYRLAPRVTFIRASQYVEHVLKSAVRNAGSGEGCWPSTHLVTLEVQVTDLDISHSAVVQETLNGSALVLLHRYLERFALDVAVFSRESDVPWLRVNYQWLPMDSAAKAVRDSFGRYE